jgi:hypothetical protein
MEIIILIYWSIWSERNRWIFDNMEPNMISCKENLLCFFHRVK